MPKIKRKRKINYSARKVKENREKQLRSVIINGDIARANVDEDSFNQSNPMNYISNLLRTPTPSKTPPFQDEINKEYTFETTPKSSRQNFFRLSQRISSGNQNTITYPRDQNNISPLFFTYENEQASVDEIINNKNKNCDSINNASESGDTKMEDKENEENLYKTPRIINVKKKVPQGCGAKCMKNSLRERKINQTFSKCENDNMFRLQGPVNINPYLNYDNVKIKSSKENTINELSFFTPELLRSKPASTPINFYSEKKPPRIPLNDISNNCSTFHRRKAFKTSALKQPSSTPIVVKHTKTFNVDNKEPNIQRKVSRILSTTAPAKFTKSPLKNNNCLITNYMSISYKSLIEDVSLSSYDTLGTLRRVLRGVHRYGLATARWAMSLFSLCARLANSLRKGIYDLYSLCIRDKQTKICRCSQYCEEIESLNAKMKDLSSNLADLKCQLVDNIQNNKKIETLNANLEGISKELESLRLLKNEVDHLKQYLNNDAKTPANSCRNLAVSSAAPPLAPPPPPPPPPPLPPVSQVGTKTFGIVKKNSNNNLKKDETPRPVISLDDILKVKLKKTSERPAAPRRSIKGNQPEVSLEMLQQVKLRKSTSSRLMTPSSLPEISSDGSTSPHSSLKRLLRDDSSFRIKRLRRVGGYSFDDLRKRDLLKSGRDRE